MRVLLVCAALFASVAGCVRVRPSGVADGADAYLPAAEVALPAVDASELGPMLDALHGAGFDWYAAIPEREGAKVAVLDGLFASRRVYGQVRPRQQADGGLALTVVLDSSVHERGPFAAAAL